MIDSGTWMDRVTRCMTANAVSAESGVESVLSRRIVEEERDSVRVGIALTYKQQQKKEKKKRERSNKLMQSVGTEASWI